MLNDPPAPAPAPSDLPRPGDLPERLVHGIRAHSLSPRAFPSLADASSGRPATAVASRGGESRAVSTMALSQPPVPERVPRSQTCPHGRSLALAQGRATGRSIFLSPEASGGSVSFETRNFPRGMLTTGDSCPLAGHVRECAANSTALGTRGPRRPRGWQQLPVRCHRDSPPPPSAGSSVGMTSGGILREICDLVLKYFVSLRPGAKALFGARSSPLNRKHMFPVIQRLEESVNAA